MELIHQLQAFKKAGTKVKIRYGKTVSATGVITELSGGGNARVYIQTSMGEYGIPVVDVKSVTVINTDG
jgi:hypothetical protein